MAIGSIGDCPLSYLRCEETDDLLTVYLTVSRLCTEEDIQGFWNSLMQISKRAGQNGKNVVLDFTAVEFASSAMIGKIVLFYACVKKGGVDLAICGLGPSISEVFRITRLDRVFRICRVNDPDPFGVLRFEPDLFEVRNDVLEVLLEKGFVWMTHFKSVDLLHNWYGIEVTGIAESNDANAIHDLLKQMYPKWRAG